MRWITFFILLFFAAALQSSHFGGFPRHGADAWPRIEYLIIVAVFYSLYASENAAPLTGFFCGLSFDLISGDYIGLNAVPLALIAWGIVRIRLSMFREHAISQILITLLAVLAFGLLNGITHRATGSTMAGNSFLTNFGLYAGNAVYSAIVAPLFFWIFFRFPGLVGFSAHGPRTRGHS